MGKRTNFEVVVIRSVDVRFYRDRGREDRKGDVVHDMCSWWLFEWRRGFTEWGYFRSLSVGWRAVITEYLSVP